MTKYLPRSRLKLSGEVKKAAEGEDVAAIKSATEALGAVIQKIGGAMYEQPNAAPGNESGSTEPNPNGEPDVVDGEVKE